MHFHTWFMTGPDAGREGKDDWLSSVSFKKIQTRGFYGGTESGLVFVLENSFLEGSLRRLTIAHPILSITAKLARHGVNRGEDTQTAVATTKGDSRNRMDRMKNKYGRRGWGKTKFEILKIS